MISKSVHILVAKQTIRSESNVAEFGAATHANSSEGWAGAIGSFQLSNQVARIKKAFLGFFSTKEKSKDFKDRFKSNLEKAENCKVEILNPRIGCAAFTGTGEFPSGNRYPDGGLTRRLLGFTARPIHFTSRNLSIKEPPDAN